MCYMGFSINDVIYLFNNIVFLFFFKDNWIFKFYLECKCNFFIIFFWECVFLVYLMEIKM